MDKLKLSELNGLVKGAIEEALPAMVWVMAEISELKTNRSGHCYLSLVEKDVASDAVVAQARGTIWSYSYRMLKPFFESTTGQSFREGLKVLLKVTVEFHPLYGYSLNIRDIDPTYTLGDMARKRKEIIERLQAEGVFDMNRELELPTVPQRIAVISSPTAAGYQDFMNQLHQNDYHIRFYTALFPAVMQGNQAEASLIDALEQIYAYEDFFDVVVIIRGGGSQLDLSTFDSYELAFHLTQFPIPVLTGIGHEKDDSIADMVAHTRLKTPTAVAEFLVTGAAQFEAYLDDLETQIVDHVEDFLSESKDKLERMMSDFVPQVREVVATTNHRIAQASWRLDKQVKISIKDKSYHLEQAETRVHHLAKSFLRESAHRFEPIPERMHRIVARRLSAEKEQVLAYGNKTIRGSQGIIEQANHVLALANQKAKLLDPENVLKRGYAIAYLNGKALKSSEGVQVGDKIVTHLGKGKLESVVTATKDNKQK